MQGSRPGCASEPLPDPGPPSQLLPIQRRFRQHHINKFRKCCVFHGNHCYVLVLEDTGVSDAEIAESILFKTTASVTVTHRVISSTDGSPRKKQGSGGNFAPMSIALTASLSYRDMSDILWSQLNYVHRLLSVRFNFVDCWVCHQCFIRP